MKSFLPVSSLRNFLLLLPLLVLPGTGFAQGTLAVQGLSAGPEPSTQTYIGTITSGVGPQASLLPVGATIIVSATVDLAAADLDPDPQFGEYEDGVLSLRVQVPAANFSVVTGTGFLGVGNDYGFSDKIDNVHYYGSNDIVGSLGAYPVQFVALNFLETGTGGANPTMVDSDAIPTAPIQSNPVLLDIVANTEYNQFTLQLEPVPTVAESVEDAVTRIGELMSSQRLNAGVGRSLLTRLFSVLAASDARGKAACGLLTGMSQQVANIPRRTPDEVAVGAELDALLLVLGAALGGC